MKKLILVSSGPFEEKFADLIMETRLSRLSKEERRETLSLLATMGSPTLHNDSLIRFVELMAKADSYDPLPRDREVLLFNPNIYQRVWAQASKLRSSGELLKLGDRIQCCVVAIHGDYDPHSFEGVKAPLSCVLRDFRFILLPKCGHYPWLERRARKKFYDILRSEIGLPNCDGSNG